MAEERGRGAVSTERHVDRRSPRTTEKEGFAIRELSGTIR